MKSPLSYFETLEDPRIERTKGHLLSDIIFISIAAVISGAGGLECDCRLW